MSYELGASGSVARARAISRRGDAPQLGGFLDFFSTTTKTESQRIKDWRGAVRSRGNADVVAPRTAAFGGQLAERIAATKVPAGSIYPSPAIKIGLFWFVPAPQAVQDDWGAIASSEAGAIANQAAVERVQSIPGDLITGVVAKVPDIVGAVTGIPKWAIPVLLIGGGAFVLMSAAHSFLPDRRK